MMNNRALTTGPGAGDGRVPGDYILGQDKVSPEAVAETRRLLTSFERVNERRFEFERIISEGSFGVTLRMRMREQPQPTPGSIPVRRFVMKRSLNQQGRENIQREIGILRVSLLFWRNKRFI